MNTIKFLEKVIKKYHLVFAALLIFVSAHADAMSVYFEKPSSDVQVGDTIMLGVYLDSGDIEINGIEGVVKISGPVTVQYVNVAGSVFSLWPNKPSVSGEKISFVGGSTSGVFGKKNKIFSIIFKASDIGKVQASLDQADVFLNDGKGTRVASMGMTEAFDISKTDNAVTNQLSELVLNDKKIPESFKIELGRDASVYDGKYFISFYSTDDGSGINRYEVRENNLASVRSGNTYILQDQSLKGSVEVWAIDNAGNVRVEKLEFDTEKQSGMTWFVIVLVIVALIGVISFFKTKKHNIKK